MLVKLLQLIDNCPRSAVDLSQRLHVPVTMVNALLETATELGWIDKLQLDTKNCPTCRGCSLNTRKKPTQFVRNRLNDIQVKIGGQPFQDE